MKEIQLPELGENIESAEIVSMLVQVGDTIKEDDPILEIETDKATIEVPSSESGTVKELKVQAGDTVKVGQVIMVLDSAAEESTEESKPEEKEEEKEEPTHKEEEKTDETQSSDDQETSASGSVVEYKLPELGENIEEAEVISVLVNEGDTIKADDPILEIETDKATIEVPSTVGGTVKELLIKAGEKAKVGAVIMKIETTSAKPQAKKAESKKTEEKTAKKEDSPESKSATKTEEKPKPKADVFDSQPPILSDPAPAAPSVRRIAREIGVNIDEVDGTGPNGRITMDDVKAHSKKLHEGRIEHKAVTSGSGFKQEPLPDFSKFGEIEVEAMNNIRKKTAEHLSYAWATIPHVTQFDKADTTDLEKMRKALGEEVKAQGGKLTLTAILVKVIVAALKKYPQFNCSIDMEKKEIIYKKYYNIGIAVDTDRGLIVPVIKDADKKSLTDISIELGQIAEKARDRKIGLEDLQGGNFSISNLGGIGGTYFTPIVNSPEVAILGVSRGAFEPVYKDGEFVPRLMVPLSLSYDHRIIDGADAIRFLRYVVEVLEQPLKLVL